MGDPRALHEAVLTMSVNPNMRRLPFGRLCGRVRQVMEKPRRPSASGETPLGSKLPVRWCACLLWDVSTPRKPVSICRQAS